MTKVNENNIFLKRFPHIDVHGETKDTVVYIIEDFINDNIKLKQPSIVIIHGKGTGTLKKKTHEILTKNKNVTSFYLDNNNLGCTVVNLKVIDKTK